MASIPRRRDDSASLSFDFDAAPPLRILHLNQCTNCFHEFQTVVNARLPGSDLCDKCRSVMWKTLSVRSWAKGWINMRGTPRRLRLCAAPDAKPITKEYLIQMWHDQCGRCALSGVDLTLTGFRLRDAWTSRYVSVDRIDSTRGYQEGNIHLVCFAVNMLKRKERPESFHYWCSLYCKRPNRKTVLVKWCNRILLFAAGETSCVR